MGSGAGSESGWGGTAGTLSQREAFPSCPPCPLNQASQGSSHYEMSTGDSGHPLNWGAQLAPSSLILALPFLFERTSGLVPTPPLP